MLYDKTQLEAMKMPELKHLALEMKLDPSNPSETKEMLINRLMIATATEPNAPEKPLDDQLEAKPSEKVTCTIEQVKAAVNPFILRGMKLFYDKDSQCWRFCVQLKSYTIRDSNTGETRLIERWRDDSGTLNQPLAVIKRCAQVLMQNAPTPQQVKPQFNPADGYEAVA